MTSRARQFADQVSNLITISSGGSDFITPEILSASVTAASAAAVGYTDSELENIDLSEYATISQLSASISNIDVTSSIEERVFVGSASPTTPVDGQIWIDNTTASAPVISVYENENWNTPSLGRFSASGGIETVSGQYKIHVFNASSNFICTGSKLIEYLVVGGGGGGGSGYGGGGGAGGYLSGTSVVSAGVYPIVIGGGGSTNTSGTNTSAFLQISYGGGNGAPAEVGPGGSGASGGGGGGTGSGVRAGGSALYGSQGNNGGSCFPQSSVGPAGGGGGAGSAGSNASSSKGGDGGAAISNAITGSTVFYCGGGGGGTISGTRGFGGSGVGGNGGVNGSGQSAGSVNTGSGGGGYGSAGGSGVVIVRYLI